MISGKGTSPMVRSRRASPVPFTPSHLLTHRPFCAPSDFDNHENRALANNSAAFILTARRNNPGGMAPVDLNMQKEWVRRGRAGRTRAEVRGGVTQRDCQVGTVPRRVCSGRAEPRRRAGQDHVGAVGPGTLGHSLMRLRMGPRRIWQTEFSALGFSNFECAQMLNLRPASSDEAKTLITRWAGQVLGARGRRS